MAEEIRWIGLNFEDAENWVHGVEAMAESQKASFSQLINPVHNLEHPAVSSTSTEEAGEAKMPATVVRRIAANLEITSAQVAPLTGQMHRWETMPKPESAKVEALELLTRSRGGPGHGTLRWTRASKQAGKALRSQGHHHARVM